MIDFENTVAGIEQKVWMLLEEIDRLRTVEAKLTEERRQLQEEVKIQNITINNLKEDNKILKLGNALTQKGDSAEIKLKINQLIRNIDNSLAIINSTSNQ